MSIDRRTVDHVARLARLALSDEERDRFTRQLAALLEHFATLQQLETEGVEPTFSTFEEVGAVRDDTPRAGLPRGVVYDDAPEHDGFFKVPPVIETEGPT